MGMTVSHPRIIIHPHIHTSFLFHIFCYFTHIYFPASSGQVVVTGIVLSSPRSFPSFFIGFSNLTARRFFIDCLLLSHALALSASQFEHWKNSHEFIRVCALGASNLRNQPIIPDSRIT